MSQLSSSISLPQLAYKGVPVVTTETLAHAYEVEAKQIRQNFANNNERFIEGKHFYSLSGNDLKEFKNYVENFDIVHLDKRARHFTLWTERGAARHAKMLNSDRAWDVFELLEETFFRVTKAEPVKPSSAHPLAQSTVAEREPLRSIVNAWARMSGQPRNNLWPQVRSAFNLTNIKQLPSEWVPDAVAWVQAKIDALPPTREQAALPAPKKDKFDAFLEEVETFRVNTQRERDRLFHAALDLVDVYKTGGALSRALFSVISDWLDKTALSPTSIFDPCLTPYAPILIVKELERKLPSVRDFLPGKKK